MQAKRSTIAAALAISLAATTAIAAEPSRSDQADLERKAAAVRATAAEMNFLKIPWETDLFEGFRAAEMEKRPVFLYLITGDPLDDC